MALEGSLKEFGLADILQLIYFQRKTGILTLEGRLDKVRLLFYEGSIISAESKRRVEANRVGKVLVKRGIIKEEDLQKALEEQQSTGTKLGNILIKNGLVEREQIQEIITSQINETVIQLFGWKEGFYEFSPQGVPVDKDIPVSLDTQHLLMEGLRIIDEWSIIEGKLTLDTVFEKTGKYDAELTQEESEILDFVDGEKDVSAIVDASQMDSFQASKALVSLLEKDVIEPREASPVVPEFVSPERAEAAEKKGISVVRYAVPFALVISFLIVIISALYFQRNIDISTKEAYENLDSIRFRIEVYKYKNGSYPSSPDQIALNTDRWGRSYIYKTEGDTFILLSTGPDGKEGTKDDIY